MCPSQHFLLLFVPFLVDGFLRGRHIVEPKDSCEAIRHNRKVHIFVEAGTDSWKVDLVFLLVQFVKRHRHVITEPFNFVQVGAVLNNQWLVSLTIHVAIAELLLCGELEIVAEELQLEDFLAVGV